MLIIFVYVHLTWPPYISLCSNTTYTFGSANFVGIEEQIKFSFDTDSFKPSHSNNQLIYRVLEEQESVGIQ